MKTCTCRLNTAEIWCHCWLWLVCVGSFESYCTIQLILTPIPDDSVANITSSQPLQTIQRGVTFILDALFYLIKFQRFKWSRTCQSSFVSSRIPFGHSSLNWVWCTLISLRKSDFQQFIYITRHIYPSLSSMAQLDAAYRTSHHCSCCSLCIFLLNSFFVKNSASIRAEQPFPTV